MSFWKFPRGKKKKTWALPEKRYLDLHFSRVEGGDEGNVLLSLYLFETSQRQPEATNI